MDFIHDAHTPDLVLDHLDIPPLGLGEHILVDDHDDVFLLQDGLRDLGIPDLRADDDLQVFRVQLAVLQELAIIINELYFPAYSLHWITEFTWSQITRVFFFILKVTAIPNSVFPAPHGKITTPDRAIFIWNILPRALF